MDLLANSNSDVTDTDAVVDQHLVTFRSVSELQANNQKLIRVTRELGQRMESQEADLRSRIHNQENAAVSEAHELIKSLKDGLSTAHTKLESAIRERDMFRRLVSQNSSHGLNGRSNGIQQSSATEDEDAIEARRALSDLQTSFDAYRNEMSIDLDRMKEDLANSHRSTRAAEVNASKAQAQADFLTGLLLVVAIFKAD